MPTDPEWYREKAKLEEAFDVAAGAPDYIPEVGTMVLVPREPTPEMRQAAYDCAAKFNPGRSSDHIGSVAFDAQSIYRAMVEAAPQPSMEGEVEETAEEERDALLGALGFRAGPLGNARDVILKDAAALRPEMVRARNAERELKSDRDWDRLAAAELLRKWVRRRFGPWITWRTAWAAVDEIFPGRQALSEGEQNG